MFGRRRSPGPVPRIESGGASPRTTLERLLLPALERPPCWVAFSGGRDSSAILAAATRIAREHGLEDPVPLTLRFALHPRTSETDWQELVVRHLGIGRWEIVPITSELEALGPVAAPALRRHGLYWPPNAHTLARLFQAASGGALITGNGGDEIFTPRATKRPSLAEFARARPRWKAFQYGAYALLPRSLKIRVWTHRTLRLPWLRPTALREVRRLYAKRFRDRPTSWRDGATNLLASRYVELTLSTFEALARDAGMRLVQPFYDPLFLGAVADVAPRNGFPGRAAAMRELFGDLLPHRSIERSTKASFTEVFYGPACRVFAESWDGTGLDTTLVDPDGLRREWSKPRPDFRSLSPLQAAWLAAQPGD
ncbi:MAG TPA: asparagine synthase-related protein [Gemmatimonadota bacterium]|nr:asparagine synthase-related protein [Gemmatimonadota bacterium]